MADRKYYTFLNIHTGKAAKDGADFNAVTISGLLTRIEERRTSSGKKVFTASMPINGRSKIINAKFGTSYGDDDTIWATVQFWEDRADRFGNMKEKYGDPDKMRIVIVGTIDKRDYTTKNGKSGVSITINASDWELISTPSNSNSNAASQPTAQTPAPNTTPNGAGNQNTADDFGGDFDGLGDFIDLDGSEDDLPF